MIDPTSDTLKRIRQLLTEPNFVAALKASPNQNGERIEMADKQIDEIDGAIVTDVRESPWSIEWHYNARNYTTPI
jgi:hypothetical protein